MEVYFSGQQDPMFVEYDAYDVFEKSVNDYDYFLFTEDDVLMSDSWFLEKIKKFNFYSPYKNYVLVSHRFEYFNGNKLYIDQIIYKKNELAYHKYSGFFKLSLDDATFVIFQNSNAGLYCLNKEQLLIWKKSGYKWKTRLWHSAY